MAASLPPKPLRIALIGLSSSNASSWASAAHLPALRLETGQQRLRVTALLNSSEQAARRAVSAYGLPAATKTYGSAEALAADPDVDVVVCNTRVDAHHATALASIAAGKDAYIEWPIAGTAAQRAELARAARDSGARVAIGLQRRWAPPVRALREIVAGGSLGKVLSSEVRMFGGTDDRERAAEGVGYFAERRVGGNVVVISVGHCIDFVQAVVGELVEETVATRFQLQRPEMVLFDRKTGEERRRVRSDVPDLFNLHGRVASPHAAEDASLFFSFRRGQPFPGTPALEWRINLERGEARLVSAKHTAIEADPSEVVLQIHHFDTDEVEDVAWDWTEEQKQVPYAARNVLSSLWAFADGNEAGDGWVSIEDAARRAAQIEGWLQKGGW